LTAEPDDEGWKQALYRLLDKNAELKTQKLAMHDELLGGSRPGGLGEGVPEITVMHHDLGSMQHHDDMQARTYTDMSASDAATDMTAVRVMMGTAPSVAGPRASPRKNLRINAERRKMRAEELVEEASVSPNGQLLRPTATR
jgi:hypothetical protein